LERSWPNAKGRQKEAISEAASKPLLFLAITWLLVAVTTGAGAATTAAGAE